MTGGPESVSSQDWQSRAAELLELGYEFLDLHTAGHSVRATFGRGAELHTLVCQTGTEPVPTLVGVASAAAWDEREAAELGSLAFAGHDVRPLTEHPAALGAWTTPVHGRDTHQVAVGPIHAGIIESGHFRFHVVGERILHMDLRLFYGRRGIERAAEGRDVSAAIDAAARACAACTVANSVAYAQACEQALGLWPDAQTQRARAALCELERGYNHLHDLAAACAGVGFAAGNQMFAALKERWQRVNDRLTGHRFLFDTVRVGGTDLVITAEAGAEAWRQLEDIRAAAARAWHETLFNGSVNARFRGVGALTRERAAELGVVGPAARGSGIATDVRAFSPRLAYPADFRPAAPDEPTGDVLARIALRAAELPVAVGLLEPLLCDGIAPGECARGEAGSALGSAIVESPRGRTFCAVELAENRVVRLRLRTASYANWAAVAEAATGEILPEFPLINKSFELCYACCDR